MKIAIIRSEVSYTKGGAERYAANLCKELCEMGHEVWVLAEVLGDNTHPAIHHQPIKVDPLSSARRQKSFHSNAQAALAEIQPQNAFSTVGSQIRQDTSGLAAHPLIRFEYNDTVNL